MKVYTYDANTHEYLKTIELETGWNPPSNSTTIEPPKYKELQIPVFYPLSKGWKVEEDYRRKIDQNGFIIGGKPYYEPSDFWWAEPTYNTVIGAIPKGKIWDKMEKPSICTEVTILQGQYDTLVEELKATDYYARRCYEYEKGLDSHTTKASYEFYISELKRLANERTKLAPWEQTINTKKAEIVEDYGEEALKHL